MREVRVSLMGIFYLGMGIVVIILGGQIKTTEGFGEPPVIKFILFNASFIAGVFTVFKAMRSAMWAQARAAELREAIEIEDKLNTENNPDGSDNQTPEKQVEKP